MEEKNIVSIKRVPGDGAGMVRATISIEFDPGDAEAAGRFAAALRELMPDEEDRAKFMAEFERAGREAGFQVPERAARQ